MMARQVEHGSGSNRPRLLVSGFLLQWSFVRRLSIVLLEPDTSLPPVKNRNNEHSTRNTQSIRRRRPLEKVDITVCLRSGLCSAELNRIRQARTVVHGNRDRRVPRP